MSRIDIKIFCGRYNGSMSANFYADRKQLTKITSFGIDKVINGTGIVLHTGFGRAPISREIFIESFEKIYPYSNLEFDVNKNIRGDRNLIVQNLINPLVGSQSCLVVNNCRK